MSAPTAAPGADSSAVRASAGQTGATGPAQVRPSVPWMRIAAAVAAVSGSILVLALFAGVLTQTWNNVVGTSFGFVPLVGWGTAVALSVVGLLVALAIAVVALILRRRTPAETDGATTTPGRAGAAGAPIRSRRITMLAVAAALAGGSILFFAAFSSAGLGSSEAGRLLVAGAGMIAILGVIAAVVVAMLAVLPQRTTQATSLGTRAFVVLMVAMVVPSLLLAGLGAYVSVWVWDSATGLRAEEAQYSAQRLSDDVDSLRSVPGALRPVARAGLTRAIVKSYAAGNTGGAWLSTMTDIKDLSVLPRWAIRDLAARGYAVGAMDGGPAGGSMPDIVAWRTGPREVRYFTSEALSVPVLSSSLPLYRAPLGELAVIAGMGVAVVVSLGLLGAWLLSRGVVRPVRRLAAASGRLAEGEAGVTVTPEGPRELRELALSFNDMNAKMAKAQETEQAFLLSVSHELKTPLTSIRGYAEGIGDGTVKPHDGAEVIGAESGRLERLVGDLLESGRLRKAAFTVRREPVGLAAVAEDVARRHEATARDAGLTLLLNTEAGGSALADHDRVLQVVSNLVENAIRCTPAPGTVTIATAGAAITVSDTGRGLTSDDLPRAFERFYLYSRYGTDRPVGTGLGLAIVKELTEAMDGTVSVASAVGVGTAFTVALPAGPASGPADGPVVTPASTAVTAAPAPGAPPGPAVPHPAADAVDDAAVTAADAAQDDAS